MANIEVPFNFTPRPYQLHIMKQLDGIAGKKGSGKKRAFLRWHRRAGKDKVCWAYMVKEAARNPGNYFYVFPYASQGKKALWNNIDKDGFKTVEHLPSILVESKRDNDMFIKLTNGSTIQVVGSDADTEALRGVATKGIVFSEFAFEDPTFYKVMMPSVREADGWAIFNSTPNGRNHFYDLDTRVESSERWIYSELQTLWPDRPNYSGLVSEEDIGYIKDEEGYTEEDVEREFGVSYSTGMKGAFYIKNIEKAKAEGRIGNFPVDDHRWVDTFWDLGVDDSTAIWFRQLDGSKVVWVDYFEDSNKDIAYYVKILQNKGYNFRTHYLPWDGGHRTIQTMYKTDEILRMSLESAGLPSDVVVTSKQKVQDGINAVRSRFSKYYFNEGLTIEGIRMLELYHRRYDPKRNIFMKDPVHDWTSHCADALRTEALAEEFQENETNVYRQNLNVIKDFDVFDD